MPYKDPEKRRAFAREWQKTYQPAWRAKHPLYARDYQEKRAKENPELFKQYEANRDPEERRRNARAYYWRNKHKVQARGIVSRAIKKGTLIKPDACSRCSSTNKIEADHHDYSKPLEVTWLCKECHKEVTLWRLRNNIVLI